MKAQLGDRLVLEGAHVGDRRRIGVIIALRREDGTPPYVVRWLDSGQESLVYPGSQGRIEPGNQDPSGTVDLPSSQS
ncbi:MAG TPA: DUF1918 domain-containing protein [Micromonosporaceae bacterium]|nr:DUF1918 domain-containing protein [Micromonosporaceae bacterium]